MSRVTAPLCKTLKAHPKKYWGRGAPVCRFTSSTSINHGPVKVLCSWCGRSKK